MRVVIDVTERNPLPLIGEMDCLGCSLFSWAIAAMLAVLVLCRLSDTVQFYAKMFAFAVGSFLLAATLPLPLFVLRPRHYKNAL